MDNVSSTPGQNRQQIVQNRKKIFLLEHEVKSNRTSIQQTRDSILQNRRLIDKNFEAIFNGHTALSDCNTDLVFRNRSEVIKNLPADDQVTANFRDATLNKCQLELFNQHSKINQKMNDINEELATINARLIEINKSMMTINTEVVQFTTDVMKGNRQMIEAGVEGASNVTAEGNAVIIASNRAKIDEITLRNEKIMKKNGSNWELAKANRSKIDMNGEAVVEKTREIEANRDAIHQNALKIAEKIH